MLKYHSEQYNYMHKYFQLETAQKFYDKSSWQKINPRKYLTMFTVTTGCSVSILENIVFPSAFDIIYDKTRVLVMY